MEVIINHNYENKKELKEIVKTVAEIEKECGCHCTLNLNKLNFVELDPRNIEKTEENLSIEKDKAKESYLKIIKGEKTVNEVRKEYGLSPITNGDSTFIDIKDNLKNKKTIQMVERMNSELNDIRKLIQLLVKIQLVCNFEGALNLKRLELFPVWIREELLDCMYLLHLDKKE